MQHDDSDKIEGLFHLALEHYRAGDYWKCVLALLGLLKLVRKLAKWPVITFKEYQTVKVVFHEGYNIAVASKILGCTKKTVYNRIKKIKKYYPDLLDEKGCFCAISLPKDYENYIKDTF